MVCQNFELWSVPLLADADCLGDRGAQQQRIGDWRQINEMRSVGEHLRGALDDFNAQARFAGTRRSDQGQQPHVLARQQVEREPEFGLAADEWIGLRRQTREHTSPWRVAIGGSGAWWGSGSLGDLDNVVRQETVGLAMYGRDGLRVRRFG